MFGRLVRMACAVLAVAVGLVTPVLTVAETSPASADAVINGCTIVSNPTPTNFTNCPGADLSAADLSAVDLSFADLAGAAFATCNFIAGTCTAANLTGANLTDANLSKAAFFSFTTLPPPPGHGSASAVGLLNSAIMVGADISGANMESGQLAGANMTGVNATGTNLGYSNFTDVNLTDANLTDATTTAGNWTGVILAGAILTGTDLLPQSPETWFATSDAGAVVTWQPLVGVSGLTSGPCTPASGSTFPVNTTTTVTCQILDDYGNAATGTFQVTVLPTQVIFPSYLGNVSGVTYLDATAFDAAGITKVVFELTGGGFTNQVIATATSTLYGWLARFNTTTVPDNAYDIVAVATDADNATFTSPPYPFHVYNGAPATTVLVPSSGASVSGTSSVLNASASPYVSSVTYKLSGGPSNLVYQVIATGTPTYYGWLSHWNTATVPNGTYSLVSDAAFSNGVSNFSTTISITVNNPLPATSILIPSQATTLSGSTTLDATGSNASSVEFLLFGGIYGFAAPVVCTATPTYYGWLCTWNTSTVPNGSYVLVSEAFNSAGINFSTGVNVTVNN